MIQGLKDWGKSHWPALRLRTILFAVLFFTAAMPGIGAVFLRVYENTLVRQTEAELVAQTTALAAAAESLWPGAPPPSPKPPVTEADYFRYYGKRIDLSRDPILAERPDPRDVDPARIDPQALMVAEPVGGMIDRTTQSTLASVLLLDRNGRVVRGALAGGDYSAVPEVRRMLDGQATAVLRRNGELVKRYRFEWLSRAASLRVHYAKPIVVDGEVVGGLLASRSARALFRGIYEDGGKIAIGVIVIFSVLLLLASLVSRGVTRPIEGLSRASKDVAAGRGGAIPETPETAAIEIRQLYADFREMADTIAVRSAYLRDFAAALSHEFKTPLAGIAGAVEILEDHYETMSEKDRRRFLSNISADTARLSQLVRRLLDLARADMAAPEGGAAADVDSVARSLADALSLDGFRVKVEAPSRLPQAAIPTASLETVLSTLIENARQAGASEVEVKAKRSGGLVLITVCDDGPGIPEGDFARVFEPFFTSRRSEGGSGLGLPIARSLLAGARGEIATVRSDKGARFEIRLPLAT